MSWMISFSLMSYDVSVISNSNDSFVKSLDELKEIFASAYPIISIGLFVLPGIKLDISIS